MAHQWVVERDEVVNFCARCLVSQGVKTDHATTMGEMMAVADLKGHYSHGLNRLDSYIGDLPVINRQEDAVPIIVKEKLATAHVDGNNLWGPVVGNFCMDLAMKKAKEAGIGWVSVKGCNHFGTAGWYSTRAMEAGFIGMAFTNSTSTIVPTRAKKRVLGTNPIAVAAPAGNGDSFNLDMATSVVAFGKVEIQDRKNEPVPAGWGMDKEGKPTVSTKVLADSHNLYPLGGPEETSGYKGYGLAIMVDIFCGLLSGASFGQHIRHWTAEHDGAANLGQCFVAIDPNAFAPGFSERLTELLTYCRNLEPAEGEKEVLIPGDPEKNHAAMCEEMGGIPYGDEQLAFADAIAQRLKIKPIVRKITG